MSGSDVVGVPNVGGLAEMAKDAVSGILPSISNPFNMGTPSQPDVEGAASGAKDAASSVAGVLKEKLPGGVN